MDGVHGRTHRFTSSRQFSLLEERSIHHRPRPVASVDIRVGVKDRSTPHLRYAMLALKASGSEEGPCNPQQTPPTARLPASDTPSVWLSSQPPHAPADA